MWDESIPMAVQVAEAFVEEASGFSSEHDFLLALYQEVMSQRRREWDRERKRRRRDIARGLRGFQIEETRCRICGKVLGRLKGVCGRPRHYCPECESMRQHVLAKLEFKGKRRAKSPSTLRVGT